MSKYKADNLTIGKDGKAYYGKGTKGGMAPQPVSPNNNIKDVNIQSSKQIALQTSTTGIGVVVTGEARSEYVAYGNAYTLILEPHQFNNSRYGDGNLEQHLQNVELDFNNFKKALNKIGYMDEQDPIITFKFEYDSMRLYVGDDELFEFDLLKGDIVYYRDGIQSVIWGWSENIFIGKYQEVISPLKETLDHITKEITDQGYKVENKHIRTIIQLSMIKEKMVGSVEDWLPYVYAGLSKEQLCEILKKENNPDYRNDYKISTSVETAKKLGSIHPSFSKKIL